MDSNKAFDLELQFGRNHIQMQVIERNRLIYENNVIGR